MLSLTHLMTCILTMLIMPVHLMPIFLIKLTVLLLILFIFLISANTLHHYHWHLINSTNENVIQPLDVRKKVC